MPKLRGATGPRLGPLGTIRNFVSVLREISFEDVREDAETAPRLLVLAPDERAAAQLGANLVGPESGRAVTARALDAQPRDLDGFDAVLVYDPDRTGVLARLRQRVPSGGETAPIFGFQGDGPDDRAAAERARALLVTRLPERAPAFGRAFPAFRAAAVKSVVDETAKANAQFALVSNIPAVIPVVGSLAAAGADFLVLTKNQIMLIFKVAAIHDRDLHDQWRIFREMLPIVGAGLFWRTVAREAASFLPLAAGTIPKVAIAYVGTVAAGRAADFYYQTGNKPSPEHLREYYRQAAEAVKKLPLPLPGRGADGDGPSPAVATAELHGADPAIDRASSAPAPNTASSGSGAVTH